MDSAHSARSKEKPSQRPGLPRGLPDPGSHQGATNLALLRAEAEALGGIYESLLRLNKVNGHRGEAIRSRILTAAWNAKVALNRYHAILKEREREKPAFAKVVR